MSKLVWGLKGKGEEGSGDGDEEGGGWVVVVVEGEEDREGFWLQG